MTDSVPWSLHPFVAAPEVELINPDLPPTGSAAVGTWEMVLSRIDEDVESQGWDQPARLFALTTPTSAGELFEDLARPGPGRRWLFDSAAVQASAKAAPLLVRELCEVTGKPREDLRGYLAPDWASGLLLVFEAWGSRRNDVSPVGDPKVGEFRILLAVTSSGDEWSYVRPRHEAGGSLCGSAVGGVLPATLRRGLSLPLTAAQVGDATTVQEYLGAVAARNVREEMDALFGDARDLIEGARPPMEVLRGVLAEVPEEAQDVVQNWVASQLALRTTLTVGWSALGQAEAGAAGADDVFAPLLSDEDLREDDAAAITATVASDSAALTWHGLAETTIGRTFLPENLIEHMDWCGEDLVGLEVATNVAPDREAELRRVEAVAQLAPFMRDLLGELGWLPAAPAVFAPPPTADEDR